MDLLKRYLNAVKFWLPAKSQDDIIAELSEDIRSQADERESDLGRPLTDDEWSLILQQRGNPLLVANRYLPQRSLIGPILFPLYWFVIKIVVLYWWIPSFLVWIGMVLLFPSYRQQHPGFAMFAALWGSVWTVSIYSIFFVTFAFAVLERYPLTWLENFNPRGIPAIRDKARIQRSASVCEMVVGVAFTIWSAQAWLAPVLVNGSGVRIALTSSGRTAMLGVGILSLLTAALGAVNLTRPYWTSTRKSFRAGAHVLTAVFFAFLINDRLIEVTGPAVARPNVAQIVDAVLNRTVLGIVIVAAILAIYEIRSVFLLQQKASAPHLPNSAAQHL